MTDLSTLTDTELNERLLELQDWRKCKWRKFVKGSWYCEACEGALWHGKKAQLKPRFCRPPEYWRDLNALKSGPEKMLRDAGWELEVLTAMERCGRGGGKAGRFSDHHSRPRPPLRSEQGRKRSAKDLR